MQKIREVVFNKVDPAGAAARKDRQIFVFFDAFKGFFSGQDFAGMLHAGDLLIDP